MEPGEKQGLGAPPPAPGVPSGGTAGAQAHALLPHGGATAAGLAPSSAAGTLGNAHVLGATASALLPAPLSGGAGTTGGGQGNALGPPLLHHGGVGRAPLSGGGDTGGGQGDALGHHGGATPTVPAPLSGGGQGDALVHPPHGDASVAVPAPLSGGSPPLHWGMTGSVAETGRTAPGRLAQPVRPQAYASDQLGLIGTPMTTSSGLFRSGVVAPPSAGGLSAPVHGGMMRGLAPGGRERMPLGATLGGRPVQRRRREASGHGGGRAPMGTGTRPAGVSHSGLARTASVRSNLEGNMRAPLLSSTGENQRQIYQGSTSAAGAAAGNPPRTLHARGTYQVQPAISPGGPVITLVVLQAGLEGVHLYNAAFVERLVQEERWFELEEYLKQYYINVLGGTEHLHPQLLLYCRRAWLIRLLRAGLHSDDLRFYHGYIGPLSHINSQFADNEDIRSQVAIIWTGIDSDSFTALIQSHPPNVADRINDYMRLHFPEVIGHSGPAGTTSPMWNFATPLGRESEKQKVRCIFCQTVIMTNRVGEDMKAHLKKCSRVTPFWRQKVRSVSFQSPSKKRPRATKEIDQTQIHLILNMEMLIRQVARGAIPTLAQLGCNEEASSYVQQLQCYFASLANATCNVEETVILIGRLVRDLLAAHLLDSQSPASNEITAALQQLMVCCRQLEYLDPIMRTPGVMAAPPAQQQPQVQNEAILEQPVVAAPLQQPAVAAPPQQPVVAAPPQQPAVAAPPQQPAVAAPPQQPAVAAPPQQPAVAAPPQQPAVAASPPQQQPVQQQLVAIALAQQQPHVQNEAQQPLVPGAMDQFVMIPAEQLHEAMQIDPASYNDQLNECIQDIPDFLDNV